MKLIILIILLISSLLETEHYIFESSANLNSEDMLISDNLLVKSHNIEIWCTDALGEYGKGRCLGTSKKENDDVSFQVYYEYFDSDNDSFGPYCKELTQMHLQELVLQSI